MLELDPPVVLSDGEHLFIGVASVRLRVEVEKLLREDLLELIDVALLAPRQRGHRRLVAAVACCAIRRNTTVAPFFPACAAFR